MMDFHSEIRLQLAFHAILERHVDVTGQDDEAVLRLSVVADR